MKCKFTEIFVISILLFVVAGCMSANAVSEEQLSSQQKQNQAVSKRFKAADNESDTAVDSALKLAQEHAALSEKYAAAQQKILELTEENKKLKERLLACEPELKQTKKELEEANNMIVDMRIEMNNWKTDTLAFRDEMRKADKIQLETLLKILQALGGDANVPAIAPDVNTAKDTGDQNAQ